MLVACALVTGCRKSRNRVELRLTDEKYGATTVLTANDEIRDYQGHHFGTYDESSNTLTSDVDHIMLPLDRYVHRTGSNAFRFQIAGLQPVDGEFKPNGDLFSRGQRVGRIEGASWSDEDAARWTALAVAMTLSRHPPTAPDTGAASSGEDDGPRLPSLGKPPHGHIPTDASSLER
jgi:hypothetical protein